MARIGVFPIDTFAFFDSANLINQGFLPIRDYWTSNGFLVDLIQSFFLNFWSKLVCIFTSFIIVNFIFSFYTYKFLKHEGLRYKNFFILCLYQFVFAIHQLECHFQIIILLIFSFTFNFRYILSQ